MNEPDLKKNLQILLHDRSMNETFPLSRMVLNRYLQIIITFLLSLVPTHLDKFIISIPSRLSICRTPK